MDPLENAVWHALAGPQQTVAEVHGRAARYQADVAPFAAVPDEPDAASWDDLRTLIGPGVDAFIFRAAPPAPPSWEETWRGVGLQLVADGAPVDVASPAAFVELGSGDIDEMLELVERTRPGPFGRRTVELGTYLGVREDARLVAMAGQRMRLPGHTEISAVCTDPAHRGRGLAAALVSELAQRIRARGDVPFLHVLAENATAIRVYDRLGFRVVREVDAVGLRAPA